MPAILPIAAEPGFSFADHWALGLLFLALALFMAIGALSHQRERAFSPSLVYLALGAIAACGLWRRSPLGAAIVLGSALAPTDPVLAGDVGVGPPGEDEGRSETEFALTAEAAANDGLGTPFLLLGLLLAELGRRGEAGACWRSGWWPTSSTRSSSRSWSEPPRATGSRRCRAPR